MRSSCLFTGAAGPAAQFQPVSHTSEQRSWAVKLDFVEPNQDVTLAGVDSTQAVVSYFRGPASQWKTGLPTYAGVAYRNLWPGIDLVYSGTTNQLKYEFVVKPGADPGRIRLRYRGAETVRLNAGGQLEVTTPLGGFHDEKPYAYQKFAGKETEVAAGFQLGSSQAFGFEVGEYDPKLPLIIDPAVAVYFAYIGGEGDDRGNGIAVDGAGNAYIVGQTSAFSDFPATAGPDLTTNGQADVFVAKINPTGTAIVYAGYIGGAGPDNGTGIAVDAAGNAYVTGGTPSAQNTFPVTVGPDLTANGNNDAFVAKINPAGTALIYCGYIGGQNNEQGNGIAVDSSGSAYVTGGTNSFENTFPVVAGPDLTANGGGEAFVAKISPDGSAIVYAGYIGGQGNEQGFGIAVDSSGSAYVAGVTNSTEGTFPVAAGPDLTANGNNDGFVAKINPSGTALVYAGYIGGSGNDQANSIAVDSSGNAYVAGNTNSAQATFPEAVGPDLTANGNNDAFVAKINSAGTALIYAGYIGGSNDDRGNGIAVDAGGNAYVTGQASASPENNFPVVDGPDLIHGGGQDAFVAKVAPDGSSLKYAGYIGGPGNEFGSAIAVDAAGSAYVTGNTISSGDTISAPVTLGKLHGPMGAADAFVAKIVTGPYVSGVFNAASWMPAGLPSHGIAQGSMFVLTGGNMGPDPLVFPGTLPLPAAMEGTSIEVTVGGVTAKAFMVYTWTNQLAAVLPSTTPTGEGTLTVTYNGETASPFPILVVSSAFGIFTRNQAGYGPAIVQNWYSPVEARVNSIIDSAVENQYEILWGSGLGAIAGSDAGLPPVGDLNVDVQVLVNGKPAVVHYKGRSAQFPGIDQIQFQVPAGIEGCYAPVVVIVNGVVSNFGTMAINSSGGACSDSVSFMKADLGRATQGVFTNLGSIVMLGIDLKGPGLPEGYGVTELGSNFRAVTSSSILQSFGPFTFATELPAVSVGACFVYQGPGEDLDAFNDRTPMTNLDAGAAINVTAPFGVKEIHDAGSDEKNVLVPGIYTFNSGPGGAAVGPIQQASITIPATQFTWTNRDAIQKINRRQDLTLTWTGGDDSKEVVVIIGHSGRRDLKVTGEFACAERVSAGQFTLPSWLLSTLPPSSPWDADTEGDPTSGLIVVRVSRLDQNRFTASGLDAGFLLYALGYYSIVPYE